MKIKAVVQNFLLLAMAIIIALGGAELVTRWLKPVYDFRDRSLLFSSPTFKHYSGGSVRHLANQQIREVAVYHDKIEYDVFYRTNNLGFIDTKDYSYESLPGKRYYAFVGDSFTAGVHGGIPWVTALRGNKAYAEVYNMGVAGTGIEHFYRMLHDMKGRVNITHIVLVAITDDFYRDFWHPYTMNGDIFFCSERGTHTRCQQTPVASIVPFTATEGEVRRIARQKYQEQRDGLERRKTAEHNVISRIEAAFYDSHIYYYSKIAFDSAKRSRQQGNINSSIEPLQNIRNEFPDAEIHLIHLPQKYEVLTKNYYINIADQIVALGINYYPALDMCAWSEDMFFKRDGHPNAYGYENISKCVSKYLFER